MARSTGWPIAAEALRRLAVAAACLLIGAGGELAAPCAACHGENGVSRTEGMPSLAAQAAAFIELQLVLFREGIRPNEPMAGVAKALREADLGPLAAWFAALPPAPPPDRGPRDPARVERGRALAATKRCGSCHGADYAGGAQMPRLAPQREDYLRYSMLQYRDNLRIGFDTSMTGILYGLTGAEIEDLAHYLASLP